MRTNVTSGEVPFRKAWLQAIVDRVEVDADVIRIVGDKARLEAAVVGAATSATLTFAVLYGSGAPCGNRTRLFSVKG